MHTVRTRITNVQPIKERIHRLLFLEHFRYARTNMI
jgi:hypothetical protein